MTIELKLMRTAAIAGFAMLAATVVASPAYATISGGGGSSFGSFGGYAAPGRSMEANERAGHFYGGRRWNSRSGISSRGRSGRDANGMTTPGGGGGRDANGMTTPGG